MFDNFEWFKSTIPGIIILGALGSLLALLILKCLKWICKAFSKIIKNILPSYLANIIANYFNKENKRYYKMGFEIGKIMFKPNGIILYLAYHCLISIVGIIIFGICITIGLNLIFIGNKIGLTITSYLLIVISYISLFQSLKHIKAVKFSYENIDLLSKIYNDKLKEHEHKENNKNML